MNDLSVVSENIRKAFRLLMGFTKTFYSIVKFIERELGLTFIGDSQICGTPPQNKAKNLDNKEWTDWFPLYYHVFNFKKGKTGSFSIILQCDTGYWDHYSADNFLDSDEIDSEAYAGVSAAKTKIIFGAVNKADVDIGQIFEGSYRDENTIAQYWPVVTKDYPKDFSLPTRGRSDKKIIFRVYELPDFKDEETAKRTVKDFSAYWEKMEFLVS